MNSVDQSNPFFSTFQTPYQTIPFDLIQNCHYEPAFLKGIEEQNKEISNIIASTDTPTFENTILAFEFSGKLLSTVSSVFFNLLSAESDDEMMEIAQKISPLLSEHSNNIGLNEELFHKVREVYQKRNESNLTAEQIRLTEYIYDGFIDNGVNLTADAKKQYRELSSKLNQLTLDFGQNVLKDTNRFELLLQDKQDLVGLPDSIKQAAQELATTKNYQGWLFDLSGPSYTAFMKYSERRDLREQLYIAYVTRCTDGDYDNQENIINIVNTRLQIANLLGYSDYATFSLKDQMAKNKSAVYELLYDLQKSYENRAKKDVEEVRLFALNKFSFYEIFQPWDWAYYSQKLQQDKYSIDDELLRPYFELENVKQGIFNLATDLYGIRFVQNDKISVYHPDVQAYEVYSNDGQFLAVLYTDFHPRSTKRQGAWMTEFKGQYIHNGVNSRPHVSLVMNFTKPTKNEPALLTFDEVETFLHEFGHGLHGIFSNTHYETLSGTNVARDLVELPSQIMENWLTKKEYLDKFAIHYQTGEKIPNEILSNLITSSNFNVGYLCYRQLSFGLLDMAWHTLEYLFKGDVRDFEKQAMHSTQLLPTYDKACMSTSFGHIFSGGYAAGYYSYKWSEVLDADAFSEFEDHGIFNKQVANSFRINILEKGNTVDPMELYIRFKGRTPNSKALLKRNGIV